MATMPVRERLLVAASEASARRGYHQVGVQAICRAAGTTTGALYHHFGSREALLTAVRERADEIILEAMRQATATLAPGPRAVRTALLAAWDVVQAQGLTQLVAQRPDATGMDPLPMYVQSLWSWAPAALGPVLVATWRGALAHAGNEPHGDAREVLDGILRGLGGGSV